MEIRISNLVEFPEHGQKQKRLTYDDKYSEYGFSLQREKMFQKKKGFLTKRFYFLNFYPALQEYVHRLFAYGYLPFDITDISKKEPDYLDRTWLLHGRCCRKTTRMDCLDKENYKNERCVSNVPSYFRRQINIFFGDYGCRLHGALFRDRNEMPEVRECFRHQFILHLRYDI